MMGHRPVLTEGRDGAIDDARVASRYGLVIEAEALHRSGPEPLHEHVRLLNEVPKTRAVRFRLEVEQEALLASVEVPEPDGLPLLERLHLPRGVSCGGSTLITSAP
jgi:hypothetical protein